MQITKEQIAEVRRLAYAEVAEREELIKKGLPRVYIGTDGKEYSVPATRGGYAKVGCLSLSLEEVNTKSRNKKALRDTYRVNGKIVAKEKILEILPE
jgi:hypothetical protein